MNRKKELDKLTLDIEFLLISVIQGVALATLASASVTPINNLQFQQFPYIITGFIFVLVFWSGAINHALSFIEWPLDLIHSFLYFLASFIEVMALNQVANPLMWFAFMLIFQIVAAILYTYDLGMIKKTLLSKHLSTPRQKLLTNVYKQQSIDLKIFIPGSLLFSTISFFSIYLFRELFISGGYHLIFITLQGVVGIVFLINLLASFKKRSKLVED